MACDAKCNGCSLLTYSSVKTLGHCQREYYWKYERCLRRQREPQPESLSIGAAFHRGREVWQKTKSLLQACQAIDSAITIAGVGVQVTRGEARRAKARALLRCSTALWPEPADRVEAVFQMPIFNPATGRTSRSFRFAGKVDEVQGKRLVEYKCIADPLRFLQTAQVDLQIAAYVVGIASGCGQQITGAEYRLLAQPSIKRYEPGKKRLKDEPLDMFEDRCLVWLQGSEKSYSEFIPVLPGNYPALKALLWNASKTVLSLRRSGGWLPNTLGCYVWNRPCSYLPLCQALTAGRNIESLAAEEYEQVESHPELAEAA